MNKTTLILLSIFLVLVIIGTYLVRKNNVEKFSNDMYFGILPKENHTIRIGKLLYYNDPIFIEYGSKYILLKEGKCTGNVKDAISIINYIRPKNIKKGLTPIAYNDPIYLKSYPQTKFNLDKEFKIVPYTKPENNQQPYVEMGDYICFITKDNEYLTVSEGREELELLNSETVPNNGIFKLSNSPQCYINYKMYGVDGRKAKLSTIRMIVEAARNYLDKEKKKVIGDDSELRTMKENEVKLKEEIQKLENSGETMALELSSMKEQYELELRKLKESIEDKKSDIKKTIEANKQLAENVIDEKYLKEMRDILNKGCN